MKLLAGIANLRNRRRFQSVLEGLRMASERFETRVVELSVATSASATRVAYVSPSVGNACASIGSRKWR